MITLSRADTGAVVGTVEDADLQVLVDGLEEEFAEDTEYYITLATVEMLERAGASASLVQILKNAVGDSEGIDIRWSRP